MQRPFFSQRAWCLGLSITLFLSPVSGWAASGTSGAAFLELPVGARPAALGNAYTSLASDAYAPTINPGGLGFVESPEIAAMHLVYLQDAGYEYLSYVHPFMPGHALGASIQYFRPGSISGTDASGNSIGNVPGYFAAYNVAYGQKVTDWLSLGATGKLVQGKIDDVSASATSVDVGALVQCAPNWRVALTGQNLVGKLTFIQDSDPLPRMLRLGTSYKAFHDITLALEGVHRESGLDSVGGGVEWTNSQGFSMRGGYSNEHTRELSPIAGMTLGVGLNLWGQELAYTWSPLGDLGSGHYISLIVRFGAERQRELRRSEETDQFNLEDVMNSRVQGDNP